MLLLGICISFTIFITSTRAAYSSNGPNVMYYWGQNSAGGDGTQETLASYCQSGQADALLLSFLNAFNVGGLPEINLAGACPDATSLKCPAVESDIKTCQGQGVKIILSLGGAAGAYGLSSDDQGKEFAQTIWDMFGGGSSDKRPFGAAIIDGIDLDIEGGPSAGYASFVTTLRALYSAGGSQLIVGAAPQCPFPDAILGSVMDAVAMDYVNVQFYNNYCSVDSGSSFNFDTWDNWAKSKSPNVKVMLTVPGSPTAAGSGYAPMSALGPLISSVASSYSSFGGVSVWDASQAWNNGGFNSELYSIVHGGPTTPTTTSVTESVIVSSTKSITESATTSVTESATVSATTSVTEAPPTSTPGDTCSSEGQMKCISRESYAICNHKGWESEACPDGTVCTSTTDSMSVYCGYVSLLHQTTQKNLTTEFFVTSYNTNNSFQAMLNTRHMTGFFKKKTIVEFIAPRTIRFIRSIPGQLEQTGNKVRIKLGNEHENVGIVLKLNGTFTRVFVSPDF